MFPHTYFPNSYYEGHYWPPVALARGPIGGGGPEDEGEGEGVGPHVPSLAEAIEILRRFRREREYVLTDEEDAILLLLLSDVFGNIGGWKDRILDISDDEEALLLAIASNPIWT